MKIYVSDVKNLCEKYKINTLYYTVKNIMKGMKVELEHGKGFTNVTKNKLDSVFKIALAHIQEYPNYYEYLEKMENELKKVWKGVKKEPLTLKKK